MTQPITVLLADDHMLVRRGFRRILEDDTSITVVGEADDGDDAVRMTRKLKPQVVLMDCAMPRLSGLLATQQIMESCPETTVLMLSMHSEASFIDRAINAGAKGYVLKNATDLDLVGVVKRAVAGELVIDSSAANVPQGERNQRLTTRELEILQMIVEGKSTKEIATLLGLSTNTIASHRTNIMKTLGIHKTADLVVYAVRNRIVNIL